MSTVFPKRRIYDGDVVNPEDFNETLDDLYRNLKDLNEHNLDAAQFRSQVDRKTDTAKSVAWRLASNYNGSAAIANEVVGNTPGDASGALVFAELELWKPIWTHTWVSEETSSYYAIANVQAGVTSQLRAGWTPGTGLDEFKYRDAANVKLAWALDGVLPSEHVRGAMDLGACGLNMERGFAGEFNAQDVSALFPMVGPGDHTIQLLVLRAEMPDEVREINKKVIVPMWDALVWEIRR